MKNDRMLQRNNDVTAFTKAVTDVIKKKGFAVVRLRNNTLTEIVYQGPDEHRDDEVFRTDDWTNLWNNDGSSFSSYDLDIIELIDEKAQKQKITEDHLKELYAYLNRNFSHVAEAAKESMRLRGFEVTE